MEVRDEHLNFDDHELRPSRSQVLREMGISSSVEVGDEVESLLEKTSKMFESCIFPKGIFQTVESETFPSLFNGEGNIPPDSPLGRAYKGAVRIALYAFTLGDRIGRTVHELFEKGDYPLGYALNTFGSVSADNASMVAQSHFSRYVGSSLEPKREMKTLLYSPGYCGWNIAAQAPLFRQLEPERIGISLNPSFMMTPVKSVTGALVAGDPSIHRVSPVFEFCKTCELKSCLGRMN